MGILDELMAGIQGQGGQGQETAGFDELMAKLKTLFSGGSPDEGRTQTGPRLAVDNAPAARAMPVAATRAAQAASQADEPSPGLDFLEVLRGKDPRDRQRADRNTNAATAALMQLSPDMSPQMARALATNPALAQILLPSLVTTNQKPDVVEIPGPYGQVTKMVWDRRKGKLVPLSSLMEDSAAGGAPSVATPDAPAAAPSTTGTGGAQPALPPMSDQARQLIDAIKKRGGPLGADDRFSQAFTSFAEAPQAPAAAGAPAGMPASPQSQAVTVQPANSGGLDTTKYTVGPGVPKPPEGYVHSLSPNGNGYLYDKATKQPIFEPKAELDARSRVGEKRADELREQGRQVGGVDSVIGSARKATDTPGFHDALRFANQNLNVSVPVPGTNAHLGGDINTPIEWVQRNYTDPQNPKWGALEDLKSTQRSLELLVARPLMKGQGQVTDSERTMITDAIGNLAKATSVADYQFRLNKIEGMIRAMNQPGDGTVTAAAAQTGRPTTQELSAVWDREGGMKEEALKALSERYHVSRGDLQNYIIDLFRASGRGQ